MPICPHNSSRLFYPQKASVSKHSFARCWRSWRSLTPRLWADWETLLTTAHSTGPFTAKWWTTETQFYIFFWLLLCSNTWPRKGWCWQLPSNNRGRKGCRRNNWVWRKYHRKVVISFVDLCYSGPPVMRTCFREGNYVEPTIVTGLPHDAPVVHRWISTKGQKIDLNNENRIWTVKISQFFSCECFPLPTPVKAADIIYVKNWRVSQVSGMWTQMAHFDQCLRKTTTQSF